MYAFNQQHNKKISILFVLLTTSLVLIGGVNTATATSTNKILQTKRGKGYSIIIKNPDTDKSLNHSALAVKESAGSTLLNRILVTSLDGAINLVSTVTGKILWRLDSQQEVLKGWHAQGSDKIISDPSTGELYVSRRQDNQDEDDGVEYNVLDKLPYSVPELVQKSPFRASDGSILVGVMESKMVGIDVSKGKVVCEFSLNEFQQNKQDSSLNRDNLDKVDSNNDIIYIPRKDYSVTARSQLGVLLWNISYIKYNIVQRPTFYQSQNDLVQKLRLLTVDGKTLIAVGAQNYTNVIWKINFPAPFVNLYSNCVDSQSMTYNLCPIPFDRYDYVLDFDESNTANGNTSGVVLEQQQQNEGNSKSNSLQSAVAGSGNVKYDTKRGQHQQGELFGLSIRKYKNMLYGNKITPVAVGIGNDNISSSGSNGIDDGSGQSSISSQDLRMLKRTISSMFPTVQSISANSTAKELSKLYNREEEHGLLLGFQDLQQASSFNNRENIGGGKYTHYPQVSLLGPDSVNDATSQERQQVELYHKRVMLTDEMMDLYRPSYFLSYVSVALLATVLVVLTSLLYRSGNLFDTPLGSTSKTNANANEKVDQQVANLCKKQFRIGQITINLDQVLGKGSNGTAVYKGTFEDRQVAVKRMLVEYYDVFNKEIGLMQATDHSPYVIRYFCRQEDHQFLYIALELCRGTLVDLIEKKLNLESAENSLASASQPLTGLEICKQILKGVQHLHKLNIVHRDLKPQNVLLVNRNGHQQILISDFGLCKKLLDGQNSYYPTMVSKVDSDSKGSSGSAAGTVGWIAPEILKGAYKVNRAIDIFSMGCVFYYVLTCGSHPYGKVLYERDYNISKGAYLVDERLLAEHCNRNFSLSAAITTEECNGNIRGGVDEVTIKALDEDNGGDVIDNKSLQSTNRDKWANKSAPNSGSENKKVVTGNGFELKKVGPSRNVESNKENATGLEAKGVSGSAGSRENNMGGEARSVDSVVLKNVPGRDRWGNIVEADNHKNNNGVGTKDGNQRNDVELEARDSVGGDTVGLKNVPSRDRWGNIVVESDTKENMNIGLDADAKGSSVDNDDVAAVCGMAVCDKGSRTNIDSVDDTSKSGSVDVEMDENFPAKALVESMLQTHPRNRPSLGSITKHPMFWSAKMALSFVNDVSDVLEAEPRGSYLFDELEIDSEVVMKSCDWSIEFEQVMLEDMQKRRPYNTAIVRDLIRLIRNKNIHYGQSNKKLKKLMGPIPHGFYNYFIGKFPRLVMHLYDFVSEHDEVLSNSRLEPYFHHKPSLSQNASPSISTESLQSKNIYS